MDQGKVYLSLFDIQTRLLKQQGVDGQGAEQLISRMVHVFQAIAEAGDDGEPDLAVSLRRLNDAATKAKGAWMGAFAKLFASMIPLLVTRRETVAGDEPPKRVSSIFLPAAPMPSSSAILPRSPLMNRSLQFPASPPKKKARDAESHDAIDAAVKASSEVPVAPPPQDIPNMQEEIIEQQDAMQEAMNYEDDIEILEIDPMMMEPAAPLSVTGEMNEARNEENAPVPQDDMQVERPEETAGQEGREKEEEGEIQIIEDDPPVNEAAVATPAVGEEMKERRKRGRPPLHRTPNEKKKDGGATMMDAWLAKTPTATGRPIEGVNEKRNTLEEAAEAASALVPVEDEEDEITIIEEPDPAGTSVATPSVEAEKKDKKQKKRGRPPLNRGQSEKHPRKKDGEASTCKTRPRTHSGSTETGRFMGGANEKAREVGGTADAAAALVDQKKGEDDTVNDPAVTTPVDGDAQEKKRRKRTRRTLDLGIDMVFGKIPEEKEGETPSRRLTKPIKSSGSPIKPFENTVRRTVGVVKSDVEDAGSSAAPSTGRNMQPPTSAMRRRMGAPKHDDPLQPVTLRWACGGPNCRLAFETSVEVYAHIAREHALDGKIVAKCMVLEKIPECREIDDETSSSKMPKPSTNYGSPSKEPTPFEIDTGRIVGDEEDAAAVVEDARAGPSAAQTRNVQPSKRRIGVLRSDDPPLTPRSKRRAERALVDEPPIHQGRGGAPNSGEEIRWTCGGLNCRMAFETSAEVYTHMLREHFLEGPIVAKCYDCGKCGDFPELIVHRKQGDKETCGAEHALLVYWIKVAEEKKEEEMNDDELEELEQKDITKELARVLRCCMHKGCGMLNQEFASYESLAEHHKEVHNCLYRYNCPACVQTFTHPLDFIRHRTRIVSCATEVPTVSTKVVDKKRDEEEKKKRETTERRNSGGREDPISLE